MKRSSFMARWPYALALVAGVVGTSCSSEEGTSIPAVIEEDGVAQQLQSEIDVAVTQNALTVSQIKAVRPILKCVDSLGSNHYSAHFGFANSSSSSISIPVGFFNRFWPPPAGRGQPTTFAPGTQVDVVQVPFNGNSLVAWVLGIHFDIATRHSKICPVGGGTGGQGTGGRGTGGQGTGGQGTGGRGTGGQGTGGQGTGGQGTGGRGTGGQGTGGQGTGGRGTGGQGTGGQGTGGQGTGGQGTGGQGTGGQGTGGSTPVCPSTCDDHNPCTIDRCDASTNFQCANSSVPDNTACNDGNGCTLLDVCLSGVCTAGAPKNCSATDQCHTAGTCNPTTGACSTPTASNGTSCNDGNACTTTDTCQGGLCTGGTTTACAPSDQCHVAGVCAPATGVCSNPVAPAGTACNDANACTTGETCQAGACTGGMAKVCTASDQCHTAGVCAAATGICSNPPSPAGTVCNDANACTTGETCQAGACTGGAPRICTPSGVCHAAGVCNVATGACSDPIAADGTSCDDANMCSVGDRCLAGACLATSTLPPSHCPQNAACEQCTTDNCFPPTDGCDLITDPTDKQLCEDAYGCFTAATHPGTSVPGPCTAQGDPTRCWCGTNPTTCLTDPAAANGPCRNAVVAAAKTADPGTIKLRFVDPAFPLGRAVNLSSCRGSFCGPPPNGLGECPVQ